MHAQVIEAVQAVLVQGEGEESAAAVGLPVSHDRGCLTDLLSQVKIQQQS